MKYQNPIIRGFHPDPSVCRVGEDYYLVTSSFEYFPGIPIYHSTDLVNWRQIGNCINRNEQLVLKEAGNSGGIWAPTIRYYEGTFYVTATYSNRGNFILSTQDILGDWSEPVWVDIDGIDPSLYFEDKKAYYCTNAREHSETEEISLAEIDLSTGQRKSDLKAIWAGTGGGWLEAPHIYYIDGWYYLMTAEGGTSFGHMITLARSKTIWGPYESCPENPILTNRNDTSKQIQCAGHGDLVDDKNGNWWLVHLGIRPTNGKSNLGRETFLTPVVFENGWLRIADGKARMEYDAPILHEQKRINRMVFDFKQKMWEPQWIFLHSPTAEAYQRKNGCVTLYPSTSSFDAPESPTFAAVRPLDFDCSFETVLDFTPQKVGDEAGVVIYLQSDFHYRICKRKTEHGIVIAVEKTADDFNQVAYQREVPEGTLHVKIACDRLYYHFYYAVCDEPMQEACMASTRFLCCETTDRSFTGTVMGIYALGRESTGTGAVFHEVVMNVE
jgi:xylan 1,4-beta-xylosidase